MATKLKKLLKSFTLIELIIVIAVIAVLGATAFLILSQWMSKSRDSRKIADLGTIDTAINVSYTSNDILPTPDNMTNIMFGGAKIWELGFFGDEAVSQIGGALTKTPSDPTTKSWYRYAVRNNKYQLGTIIENEQFSKYLNRTYAQSYFTKVQGNYNQSIIVAKIGADDVIIPAPSLIIDVITGASQALEEEYFWTNKGTYNLGEDQTNKLKVEALFSGNISELQQPIKFEEFKTNFTNTYSGSIFLKELTPDLNEIKIQELVSAELKKVSSQNVSVQYLSCDGTTHGAKVDFYKQETVGFGENCDSIKSQFECNNGNWIGENKSEYTKTICNAQLPAQCDGNDHGTVKDFFSTDSVTYGQTCTPNLKSFTCENGTWKDGENNADTTTYKYSSCVVGNPVDCNATNIVKKSVSNLDITFDITATLHGQSFEKAKTITENNGSYEYTLVGDCSNGTYQEVALSEPINKGCNTGYELTGNSCVPKNCDASTQTVNTRSYIVGVINHGGTSTITTSPIGITNGTITYTQTFQCNLGIITTSGSETTNTPTCNSGYYSSNNQCLLEVQWTGNLTAGFIYTIAGVAKYPKSCNDLLVSSNPSFKFGNTSPFNGTKFVDGVYWIKPDGQNPIKIYCDMTNDGGGWTMVYKIGGESAMKSTADVNTGVLVNLTNGNEVGGKLSDSYIKSLYSSQFKITTIGYSTNLYCKFSSGISAYADNLKANKYCGTAYSSTASYTSTDADTTWNYGFSSRYFSNSRILQLNYGDSRLGAHKPHGATSTSQCKVKQSGEDRYGCYSIVWIK